VPVEVVDLPSMGEGRVPGVEGLLCGDGWGVREDGERPMFRLRNDISASRDGFVGGLISRKKQTRD
jgi:hypothetical protein